LPWELTLLSNIQSENLLAFHYRSAEVLTRIFQGPVSFTDIKGKKSATSKPFSLSNFFTSGNDRYLFLASISFQREKKILFLTLGAENASRIVVTWT